MFVVVVRTVGHQDLVNMISSREPMFTPPPYFVRSVCCSSFSVFCVALCFVCVQPVSFMSNGASVTEFSIRVFCKVLSNIIFTHDRFCNSSVIYLLYLHLIYEKCDTKFPHIVSLIVEVFAISGIFLKHTNEKIARNVY